MIWNAVQIDMLKPVGSGTAKHSVDLPRLDADEIEQASARIGLSKVEFFRRAAVHAARAINGAYALQEQDN